MSDYIFFKFSESTTSIHANHLIAFFPELGFAIFDGYCRFWEGVDIEVVRTQPNTPLSAYFKLKITAVHKKDLQPLPKADSHACDPDECGCCIQFFPCDIIILKFDVLETDNKYPSINWNYCIDGRFGTPDRILEKYMGLVELPEDPDFEYTPCEEDGPFYEGYYKIRDAAIDVFKSQYDAVSKPKRPSVIDYKILATLDEWRAKYDVVRKAYCADNYKDALAGTGEFFKFLKSAVGYLSEWCGSYLCGLSFEDTLRGYLIHGIETGIAERKRIGLWRDIDDAILKELQEGWPLFFRKGKEADIVIFNNTEFDMSYRHHLKIKKELIARESLDFCDVPEILDMHKDRKCQAGTICGICDDQEWMWRAELKKRRVESNNIFINPECRAKFIEEWIRGVNLLSDSEQERIQYTWPPIFKYSLNSESYKTVGEYVTKLIKNKNKMYGVEGIEYEMATRFIGELEYYRLPAFEEGKNKYNEIFLFLSKLVPVISYSIAVDEKRCKELEIKYLAHLA